MRQQWASLRQYSKQTALSSEAKKQLISLYPDKVFDGNRLASKVRGALKQRIIERQKVSQSKLQRPVLGHILVGEAPAQEKYVQLKLKACAEVGIGETGFRLPASVTESELHERIVELKANEEVSGILVQLPLPGHLDVEHVINLIGPEKDVDGLHPFNAGSLALKRHAPYFVSCTPLGVISILEDIYGSTEALSGKRVALVGRSNIVGMPILTPESLLKKNIQEADIVIAACGVPRLVKSDWIQEDAVVIDVGINFVHDSDSRQVMCGDVEFNESLLQKCKRVTPVPGGVGPMTVTMLLNNLVKSWELRLQNKFIGLEHMPSQRIHEGALHADNRFDYNYRLHKQLDAHQKELEQDGEEADAVARPQSVFSPFKVVQKK